MAIVKYVSYGNCSKFTAFTFSTFKMWDDHEKNALIMRKKK